MEKIVSFTRKYYFIAVFTAFLLFTVRALVFADLSGYDFLYKVKLEDGFFQAVAFAAREIGDGVVGAFVRAGLTAFSPVVWKILCVVGLVIGDVFTAIIASRSPLGANAKDKTLALADSLAFSSAMFAMIPSSVFVGVLSIAGTVHFVIPAALLLAMYLAVDVFADTKRSLWYAPVLALIAALLSWQAAIAAIVIAVWRLVSAIRAGTFRPSLAMCAVCPLAVLIAHIILWNVPRFPSDVRAGEAFGNFSGALFGEGALYLALTALSILVCARMMTKHVVPVLKSKDRPSLRFTLYFALCICAALNAAVLILRSSLFSGVTVSISLTVTMSAITLVLLFASYIFEIIDGKPDASAVFLLALLVSLAAAFATHTFGGESFYLPLVLIFVVIGREFLAVSSCRPAVAILCGVAGCYAATLCLAKGKGIIAAAIVIVVSVLAFSPLFRHIRAVEAIAALLALMTLWTVGDSFGNASHIRAENAERIEKNKADHKWIIVLKKGGVTLDEDQFVWYREYHGIASGVRVMFLGEGETPSEAEIGDINGDGKVNARDLTLFTNIIGE